MTAFRERSLPALCLRVVGAASLAGMAAIHSYLWMLGYRAVPTIGDLFLANALCGALLALALLIVSGRLIGAVASVAALFTAGTLLCLVLSLTVGLFGFVESPATPLVTTTFVVESTGVVVLAAMAVWSLVGRRGEAAHDDLGRGRKVG